MPRALLLFLLFAFAISGQQTGTIQGTVINKTDRQPVRKAAVTLTSNTRDRSYAISVTDGAGRFAFSGIPGGSYRLQASRNQMYSIAYGATGPRQQGVALLLAPGETRAGITLQMVAPSSVQGTVTDGEGDVLGGVLVELYTRRMDRGKPRYFHASSSVSDARGHYEIGGLVPGEYWAEAQARSLTAMRTRPVAIAGENIALESVAAQFYRGVDRITSASPVLVTDGRNTTGIDFRLNYAPQVNVSGTVSGLPEDAKNVAVSIEPEGSPAGNRNSAMRMPVDPAGRFTAQALPAGQYRVTARAGSRRAVQTVQLVSPQNEVNLTLAPGVRIAGTLAVEGNAAAFPKNVRVSLSSGDDQPGALQSDVEEGAFTFEEVPAGIWDIGVRPLPRGSYIKQMLLGKQDVLLEDMEIGPTSKGPLSIVVSTAAPKVEGTVEPAGPATVLAAPTGKLADIFSFYTTAQADEKGHFTFAGLNPGPYRFYAFQQVEAEAWQDPKFLVPFEAQSKAAELKEGATEKIVLTLIGGER